MPTSIPHPDTVDAPAAAKPKFVAIRPTYLWPDLWRGENPSKALKEAATWYYALLRRRKAAFTFTGDEALALATALRGVTATEDLIDVLYAKAEAGLKATRAAQVHGVDVPRLVAKVKGLDDLGTVALLDAIDQFWRLRDENQPALDQLREVGLAP